MSREKIGSITIAPGVLTTIVRQTVLAQDGVRRLSRRTPDAMGRLLGRSVAAEGIRVQVSDSLVNVDVYLMAEPDRNLLQFGRRLQDEIAQAIHQIVGLDVATVNIHVESIVLPERSS